MSDKNGVTIGDSLLVTREFDNEFYLMLATVLGIKEEIDEETNASFIIYDVQLPDGKTTKIDEIDVMGLVVKNVPYLLIQYFVLDFAKFDGNDGEIDQFKPSKVSKTTKLSLPSLKNESFIEFSSYTTDELLDSFTLYKSLDDVYFTTVLKYEIVEELKKRGGAL